MSMCTSSHYVMYVQVYMYMYIHVYTCTCTMYALMHTVFNVGEYRRKNVGASKSHDFYHPHNEEAKKQRWLVGVSLLGSTVLCTI